MTRVILALDGTEAAEAGLALAEALAYATGSPIDFVHVVHAEVAMNGRSRLFIDGGHEYLGQVSSRTALTGDRVVLSGNAAVELRRYAVDRPGSIIVLGASKGDTLSQRVFGSVARNLLEYGDVALAFTAPTAVDVPVVIDSVLAPVDGSRSAEVGVSFARSLVAPETGLVRLIRVIHPPSIGTGSLPDEQLMPRLAEVSLDARKYLHDLAQALRRDGLRSHWEARTGQPDEEILRAAETTESDLIVLVNRVRSAAQRSELSAIVSHVVRHGDVPVVVVPASFMLERRDLTQTLNGSGDDTRPLSAIT